MVMYDVVFRLGEIMLLLSVIIAFLPFAFVILENFDAGRYKKTKTINKSQSEIKNIENIFIEVQNAIDEQDIETLGKLFSKKMFKKYNKKLEKMWIRDKKTYVKKPKLEGITRLRNSKHGFSVTLSFKAISYTSFNKDRVELHWNMIEYCFTPSGEGIEGGETDFIHFKQRWWFKHNSSGLEVQKIKDFYTKNK